MSLKFCIRPEHHKLVRESKTKNKENLRLLGSGLPGVKSAPVRRRKMRAVDWDFQERKIRLANLLPTYTMKEVQRLGHPYHILIIQTLLENGYTTVVEEINQILRKEENEMITCRDFHGQPLVSQKDLFTQISETLKFCADLIQAQRFEHSIKLRVELAIRIMKQKGSWLARHLLQVALKLTDQIDPDNVNEKRRFKAEIYCLLAFLTRSMDDLLDDFDLAKIQESLNYLTECRILSQGEPWQIQHHITINIRKAIDIHGLRKEETYVDGNSMPLYMFASLLEHEVLIKLANQMLLKQADLSDEDVQRAIQYAEDALELALEVREPEAMSSTLFRFGQVLRDSGAHEEAFDFFDQLQMHAEIKNDRESEAIGFQGLGACFNEKREPVNALEMFTLEYETAGQRQLAMGNFLPPIIDIQADALKEIGHVLLTEGETLESVCSFFLSYHDFIKAEQMYNTPDGWLDASWSLMGLSQGQGNWGRLAGLARQNTSRELKGMIKFKNSFSHERIPLPRVRRPIYNVKHIQSEWGEEGVDEESNGSSDADDHSSHVDHPHFHKRPKTNTKSHVQEQQQTKHENKHIYNHHHHHHQHEHELEDEEDNMSEVSKMSDIFISKVWSTAELEERKNRDKFSFTIDGWFRKKFPRSERSSKSYKKSDASKQKGNLRDSRFTDSESLFTMSSDLGSSPFDADIPYESDRGLKGSKSTLSHSSSSPSDQTSTSGKKSVSISITESELKRIADPHHRSRHHHGHHHGQHSHHHHHHMHLHHHGHAISTLHSHINSYMSQTSQNSRIFINKLPSYMQGSYERSFSENIKHHGFGHHQHGEGGGHRHSSRQPQRRQMSPGQIHLSHQQMTFDPDYDIHDDTPSISSKSKRTDTASTRSSNKSSTNQSDQSSLQQQAKNPTLNEK